MMSAFSLAGRCSRTLLLAALGNCGFGLAAAAEELDNTASAVLREVVVTAQRREQNLQTIAIAMSASNDDALQDESVTRLDDLQFATPGLTITDRALAISEHSRHRSRQRLAQSGLERAAQ